LLVIHIVACETVPAALGEQLDAGAHRRFVKVGTGRWLTYADADRRSDRVAAGLRELGVGQGDRVAILCVTRTELIEVFYGVAKLGAIVVPLNPYLRGEFLRYQLDDCGAAVVVADGEGAGQLLPILPGTQLRHVIVLDDVPLGAQDVRLWSYPELYAFEGSVKPLKLHASDPMSICYTSGTTGLPKGAIIPHGAYVASPLQFFSADGWFTGDDVFMTTTPFYSLGTNGMFLGFGLCGGVPVVLEPEFHASTLISRIRAEGSTVVACTGMVGMAVLAQPPLPDDADNPMRLGVWTPMPVTKLNEFAERFACETTNGIYGQTEGVPVARMPWPLPPGKRATNGRVVDSMEAIILDDRGSPLNPGEVGEICIRARRPYTMFSGYWGKAEATVEAWRALWHHTGDHGKLDQDGYLTFVDRKRDSLRHRGQNVSSFELESTIALHPSVRQVAAYAVPAELAEDEIMVAVVLEEGATLTAEEIAQYFRENLPYFAAPRYVDVIEAMPMNTMGRVTKDALRKDGVSGRTWDLRALGLQQTRAQRRG
jgi:crotonobetaine/carnitine-CoA ligase